MSAEMWCCGLYLPDRRSAPPPLTHTKVYCMTPVSHSVSQSRFLNTHALSSYAPFALVWSALVVSRFFPPLTSTEMFCLRGEQGKVVSEKSSLSLFRCFIATNDARRCSDEVWVSSQEECMRCSVFSDGLALPHLSSALKNRWDECKKYFSTLIWSLVPFKNVSRSASLTTEKLAHIWNHLQNYSKYNRWNLKINESERNLTEIAR